IGVAGRVGERIEVDRRDGALDARGLSDRELVEGGIAMGWDGHDAFSARNRWAAAQALRCSGQAAMEPVAASPVPAGGTLRPSIDSSSLYTASALGCMVSGGPAMRITRSSARVRFSCASSRRGRLAFALSGANWTMSDCS